MGGTLDYLQCDNRVVLANLLQELRKRWQAAHKRSHSSC